MEPSINADLTHDPDLTRQQLTDIGWFSDKDGVADGVDLCIGSSSNPTVIIDGCDSGVDNTVFADGCRISDRIADCKVDANGHDAFVGCVGRLADGLGKAGALSGGQGDALRSCAQKSR